MDAIDSRNHASSETKNSKVNVKTNYLVQDRHLIKKTRVVVLDKLTAREIY